VCGPAVWQVAEERLSNMRTVRAFVQEHSESLVYNTRIDNVLRLSYREALARGFFWAMVTCLSFLVMLIKCDAFSACKMYFNYTKYKLLSDKVFQILFSITLPMKAEIQNTFLESR